MTRRACLVARGWWKDIIQKRPENTASWMEEVHTTAVCCMNDSDEHKTLLELIYMLYPSCVNVYEVPRSTAVVQVVSSTYNENINIYACAPIHPTSDTMLLSDLFVFVLVGLALLYTVVVAISQQYIDVWSHKQEASVCMYDTPLKMVKYKINHPKIVGGWIGLYQSCSTLCCCCFTCVRYLYSQYHLHTDSR